MIRRPPRSTQSRSSAASDVYKRQAQELWDDPDLIEIPAKITNEPRFMVIGKIADVYWSGVITYRSNRIRIISLRRSRTEELEAYES